MALNFAIMGSPITHSLSPVIHMHFAKQFALDIQYNKIETNQKNFSNIMTNFINISGRGVNITSPLKHLAYQKVHNLSKAAQYAAAVNTITINKTQEIFGDNTDGIGFIRDLNNRHNIRLNNKKILIVGAGGAANGIIVNILEQRPKQIVVVNRTQQKAKDFAKKFDVEYAEPNIINVENFDLIINSTTMPVDRQYLKSQLIYDLNYNFKYDNTNIITGLGMLLEQAAESFYIWHGLRPLTQNIYSTLIESTAISTLPA